MLPFLFVLISCVSKIIFIQTDAVMIYSVIPFRFVEYQKQTKTLLLKGFFFNGDSLGIRTLDPLIKSQMLYQLS